MEKFKTNAFKKFAARTHVAYLYNNLRKLLVVSVWSCSTCLVAMNQLFEFVPRTRLQRASGWGWLDWYPSIHVTYGMAQVNDDIQFWTNAKKTRESQKAKKDKSENKDQSKNKNKKNDRMPRIECLDTEWGKKRPWVSQYPPRNQAEITLIVNPLLTPQNEVSYQHFLVQVMEACTQIV